MAEITVVFVVLTLAIGGLGKFASVVGKLKRESTIAQHLQWDLISARETIGSWNIEDITADAIHSLAISSVVANHFYNARWNADIEHTPASEVGPDIRSIRVHLFMTGELAGQPIEPASLVFWVVERQEGSASDATANE